MIDTYLKRNNFRNVINLSLTFCNKTKTNTSVPIYWHQQWS